MIFRAKLKFIKANAILQEIWCQYIQFYKAVDHSHIITHKTVSISFRWITINLESNVNYSTCVSPYLWVLRIRHIIVFIDYSRVTSSSKYQNKIMIFSQPSAQIAPPTRSIPQLLNLATLQGVKRLQLLMSCGCSRWLRYST